MSTEPECPINHSDAARAFEPTEHYPALRDSCPFHRAAEHDPPFYVITRYDDVHEVLRHPDLWRNGYGSGVFYQSAGVLGTTDDPDHARQRRVLQAAFTPKAIANLEPRIATIADELIDGFVDRGSCDFVSDFAEPLPALAIAELLGVASDRRDDFQRWSNDAVAALTGGDVDTYSNAKERLEDIIAEGVATRLGDTQTRTDSPAGSETADEMADVMTLLARAWEAGTIDEREMRYLGYQLLVAGHETTTSLLGMLMYRLVQQPELMAALRSDPDLIPVAVEEGLRFDSPVHGLFRTNASECTVHGTELEPDTKVQIAYASANRDPSRFDQPDEFRLDRPRAELAQHIAFGFGTHFCLGAPLARLEGRLAFEKILARLDHIELDGEPARNDSFVLHGLTSLPIRFRRAP